MKLTDITVDGFGVWHDLRVRDLSPAITVFYGPNEAGKTTLMHFLRAMLYGVTAERRERYLPPRNGGESGGRLGLVGDDGRFDMARHVERGETDRGRVRLTLSDGEEQGDRLLREALESVDERTYTNVFAIGLDEINELGALEGAEAARWIYRLTSGLDRVSLYDVIQGLRNSRKALIDSAGQPSLVADLLAKRDQLNTEIGELTVSSRRWAKLAVELDEADTHVDQLTSELKAAERHARRIELAVGLKPMWLERARVLEKRAELDGLRLIPEDALAQLDRLNTSAEEYQRRGDVLRGQRRQVVGEIRELGVNETLRRSCCRLDALAEQRDWLEALERQSEELNEDVERLDARVESERKRLAKLWRHKPEADAAPTLDEETMDLLNPAAASVREAEEMVTEARREVDNRRAGEQQLASQMESAITSGEKLGLPLDIDEAGELVSMLRKRLKAEQKVEQARRQARDLDLSNRDLVEQQVMPIEWFILSAAVFTVAAIYTFLPIYLNQPLTPLWIVGPALGVACVFARYLWEDNKADQLDGTLQQTELAEKQIADAEREQKALDKELPMTDGSVQLRLQNAERHLAELERMLPIESERRRAKTQASSAEETLSLAEQELETAIKEWRSALRSVGLPEETTAAEVEKFAAQYRGLEELESRSEAKQEEAERAEGEYAKVTRRIEALAEEAELVLEDAEPLEQLDHLLSEQRLQQNRVEHRKKLRERANELKEKYAGQTKASERIEQDRQTLFRSAGATDEEAYRALAAQHDEARRLDEQRARITREIVAAIGKSGVEDDYAELLDGAAGLRLDAAWTEATAKVDALETELRDVVARRGVLQTQREEMIADTSVADKRVELGMVEARLAQARERWREQAAVGSMLELIRADYEEHRQPETLIEASKYLEQLTRGRYPRVWTPLADDVLLVDDADGVSLPVEALSRGAREQLFLSVRLALVAMYARRGVQLPMILDDVLVNFDDNRARIAADVLASFAADGHQLLVFTCHEHVWNMFKTQGCDVRRLPVHYADQLPDDEPIDEIVVEAAPEPVVVEPEPEPMTPEPVIELAEPGPPRRKRRKKRQAPEPAAVEAVYGEVAPPPVEPAYAEPTPVVVETTITEQEYAAFAEAPLTIDSPGYREEPTYTPLDRRADWGEDVELRPTEPPALSDTAAASSWLEEAEDAWASID